MVIKAVIFDMDGVIFDTEKLWKDGFICANKQFNLDLTESFRQSICGKSELSIRAELKNLFPTLNVDDYRDFNLQYVKNAINNGDYQIKPYFIELITLLKKQNQKIALATSSHRDRAELLFKNKGLDLYSIFDAVTFAEDVKGKSKPDPTIFLLSANKIGVPASNCIVLEDSINGIEAACNGNFQPIMVVDLIEPNDFCLNNCKKIHWVHL